MKLAVKSDHGTLARGTDLGLLDALLEISDEVINHRDRQPLQHSRSITEEKRQMILQNLPYKRCALPQETVARSNATLAYA